ncbi:MAG: small ribosomal subunit Rsm22 family protein [Treponema sp.]|jgi:ribosomal protein RSM22 (predicted rRNA methylase)|nr:small ribosomal subunit Rsm22 family protein [Treponema sp.]
MMIRLLHSLPNIINKTFPIPARFRSALPRDIAELSQLLTNKRGERSLSYLGRQNFLSAYLHYFLPWNLYRLCILLKDLDIKLLPNNTIIDLGSGTLTLPAALWIAYPNLRTIPLEFFCIDRSGQALEAGKKFFNALAADSLWKINLVRKDIDINKNGVIHKGITSKNGALVCAINLFNEIYEKVSYNNTGGLKQIASDSAKLMHTLAAENGYILTVEPGVPQSGRFISFLRDEFIKLDRIPAAPCTHSGECPLINSKSKKWCHFAHENFDPPKELVRLSAAAKLPKERLVYSYLLTNNAKKQTGKAARVISDSFPLPGGKTGCYGCSEQGLVLLAQDKHNKEKILSGNLVKDFINTNKIDVKSGALIIDLAGEKK